MKFNANGEKLRNKWFQIWDAATGLELAIKGGEKAEFGSSAILNWVPLKTLEDEIGYDFATYQEEAINHVFNCLGGTVTIDSIYCLDKYNHRDVILAMMKYFDMSDEEKESIMNRLYPKKLFKPDVFYTGGGFWLSAMWIDDIHYYCISGCENHGKIEVEFPGCLPLYDHRGDDDDTEFGTMELVSEKGEEDFTETDRKCYEALVKALKETAY